MPLVWLEELLDLVFPPRPVCPLCGEASAGARICAPCLEQLARFRRGSRCFCCGRRLAGTVEGMKGAEGAGVSEAAETLGSKAVQGEQNGQKKSLCSECLRGSHPFLLARAAGPYEGTLKEAIHRYKFGKKRSLARPLGALLAGTVNEILFLAEQGPQECSGKFSPPPSAPPVPTVPPGRGEPDPKESRGAAGLVPVPLARERLAERGFNQAELLARQAAVCTGLPVLPVLQKIRETLPQTGLSRGQRQANLSGAFALSPAWQNRPPLTAAGCSGAAAILVDDVFTTGFTAGECARVLLSAGFKEVYVATLAVAGANSGF